MKKKPQKNQPLPPPSAAPLWKSAVAAALCAWALFVLISFDKKFSVPMEAPLRLLGDFLTISPVNYLNVLFADIKSLALLIVTLIGCAAWGQKLLPKMEDLGISLNERLLLGLGLGFILLSTLLFMLGLVGGYRGEVLLLVLAAITVSGLLLNRPALPQFWTEIKSVRLSTPVKSPVHFLIFLFLLLSFLMAFVPELFYDSLVYHLGLPQMFINEGRMVDTPHVYFSRFPLLVQMLYVLGLGIDGSSLAKLINWSHYIMGLTALWLLLKRLNFERGGVWGILFLAAMPVIQLNIWSTAIDVAQSAYTILTLYTFILWKESRFESKRWLLLTGIFAGAAFASKYTGVVVALTFGCAVLFGRRSTGNPILGGIVNGALFSLMVFVVMAPYLVRNFVWTGNPTYPIMSSVFESRNINQKQVDDEQGLVARSKPTGIKGWATFPWAQTMSDTSSFNYIGPMTLAGLPLLLLLAWKKSSHTKAVGLITAIYFIIALQFSGDIRYLLPGFFMLSVLLGAGFAHLQELNSAVGWIVRISFFAIGVYQLSGVAQVVQAYQPAKVITGAQTRKSYSATMHNGLNLWPWNVMEDTLRSLPEPCRIYMLTNEQVFGFPRRFWYSSVRDYTPLVIWANESKSADELYQKMRDQGFTHILYNLPESIRLKGYDLLPWTEEGSRVFGEFGDKHLKLIDVKPIDGYENSLFLFALREPGDTTPSPFQFSVYFSQVMNLKKTPA